MRRARGSISSVSICLIGVALAGSACTPGVDQAGSGEPGGSAYDTFAIAGVTTYPNGDTYTAPAHLTSESHVFIDYTDAPIRITYSVKSYTVPDGAFVMAHDFDRTTWLDTAGDYTHRGDYGDYANQGEYELRGKGISCEYDDGEPCVIDRNQPETHKFTVIKGFAGRLEHLGGARAKP